MVLKHNGTYIKSIILASTPMFAKKIVGSICFKNIDYDWHYSESVIVFSPL